MKLKARKAMLCFGTESKGLEPLEPVKARQFSKLLLSTTQPTLRFISSWLRVELVRPPPDGRIE